MISNDDDEEDDDDSSSMVSGGDEEDENYDHFNDLQPKFDLKKFNSVSDLDPNNPLTQLIDDLALDDAKVDFPLLKTALGIIDCNPSDDDLQFLIQHLSTDDSGFIDFAAFLQFVGETAKIPASPANLEIVIADSCNQLRIVQRAEQRLAEEKLKMQERRAKRKVSQRLASNKDQIAELENAQKKIQALRLRDKAMQYR